MILEPLFNNFSELALIDNERLTGLLIQDQDFALRTVSVEDNFGKKEPENNPKNPPISPADNSPKNYDRLTGYENGNYDRLTGYDNGNSDLLVGQQFNWPIKRMDLIVVFKKGVNPREAANSIAASTGGNVEHIYKNSILGMSIKGVPIQALRALQKNPNISYVEEDRIISLAPPPGKGPGSGGGDVGDGGSTTQETPWGIVRVGGNRDVTSSNRTAWVIDTGVDLDHEDLNVDRARSVSFLTRGKESKNANDENGHGSHVAGIIAAKDNQSGVVGVAAGATIVALKVLDKTGTGSLSGILAAVDHVVAEGKSGDVVNMSLGGGYSQSLNDAVKFAAGKGLKLVLAAGNDRTDASSVSPASTDGTNIYTVSAMDSNDVFASFSNYGKSVDFAAPGVDIFSTWKDGGYNTISGTSMAAPHVAGILMLGELHSDGFVSQDPDEMPDPIAHV